MNASPIENGLHDRAHPAIFVFFPYSVDIELVMYLIQQRVVSVSMRTGTPEITPELTRTIAEGVMREATDRSVEQLAEAENEILMGLLRLRTEHDVYPQNA